MLQSPFPIFIQSFLLSERLIEVEVARIMSHPVSFHGIFHRTFDSRRVSALYRVLSLQLASLSRLSLLAFTSLLASIMGPSLMEQMM